MSRAVIPYLLVALLSFAISFSCAAQSLSTVHEDSYLSIQAGVGEVGQQAIHIGDVLSLEFRVRFDESQIRVERLDSDYFHRSFSSQGGIRLLAPPKAELLNLGSGRVESRATWTFQVLDCPTDRNPCAGVKSYQLPSFALSYQLIDENGNVLNDKSIRFRLLPHSLGVAPALVTLPGDGGRLEDSFPDGAYPAMFEIAPRRIAAGLLIAVGSLLLALSVSERFIGGPSARSARRSRRAMTRWEILHLQLHDSPMSDEQWSDRLRRCIAWFCNDELGLNPYLWINTENSQATIKDELAERTRALFMDLVNDGHIEQHRRDEYLQRFVGIAGDLSGPVALEVDLV